MVELRFKTKEEFLDTYEKEAPDYDFNRLSTFEHRKILSEQIRTLSHLLSKYKPKKILEAGCGTGRILIPLSKKGYDIQGFDLSKNMLAQLKKKDASVKTKVGDIENIPYEKNSFDFVYSVTVLMHLPDIKKAFKELYRVTEENGVLVFDVPNKNCLWTRLSILLNPKRKRTKLYSLSELKTFLKGYEYRITGILSYPRTLYKIPIIKHFISFLEDNLKLPVRFRTIFFVVINKK